MRPANSKVLNLIRYISVPVRATWTFTLPSARASTSALAAVSAAGHGTPGTGPGRPGTARGTAIHGTGTLGIMIPGTGLSAHGDPGILGTARGVLTDLGDPGDLMTPGTGPGALTTPADGIVIQVHTSVLQMADVTALVPQGAEARP